MLKKGDRSLKKKGSTENKMTTNVWSRIHRAKAILRLRPGLQKSQRASCKWGGGREGDWGSEYIVDGWLAGLWNSFWLPRY